jgi:RNA-directed DNA polymerase
MTTENLMERIVDRADMETAWRNVEANRGAPGPDGATIDQFRTTFRPQWPEIRQLLLEGTYQPGSARRKSIPKTGWRRAKSRYSKRDRPLDPTSQDAAKQVQAHIRAGYRHCVDMHRSAADDRGVPTRSAWPRIASYRRCSPWPTLRRQGCSRTPRPKPSR